MIARHTFLPLVFAIAIAVAAGPSCDTTGDGVTVECSVCTRTLPAEGSACTEPGCSCPFLEACVGEPGTIEGEYACVGDSITADPGVGSWRVTRTRATCGEQPTTTNVTNAAASTAQEASSYTAFSSTAADSSSSGFGPGGGVLF